ncbi:aspartate/glutamate racemase family protein [Bacillus sp. JJ1533]|uniref:aspartate/glutamate racemase family protein n=1 Tax=Bacillus sp. JJ1533 TaxID=3122959 RepID=UPI0030007DEF
MSKKLAIVHTTPVTVEPLKALAAQYLPDFNVINFVDDSILPQLGQSGGKLEEVQDRFLQYHAFAEEAGADVILSACSSVGELVALAQEKVSVPVVRIDEAMAEEAINRGEKIGVVATLSTTLNPTLKLLEEKAAAANKEVQLEPKLADEAYKCLLNGDKEGHDRILAEILGEMGKRLQVIVLAQASMARVLDSLPEDERGKYLTSPQLGMVRVKQIAEGI